MLNAIAPSIDAIARFITSTPEGQALVKRAEEVELKKFWDSRRANAQALAAASEGDAERSRATTRSLAPLLKKQKALQAEVDGLNGQIAAIQKEDRERAWVTDLAINQLRTALETNPQPEVTAFKQRLRDDIKASSLAYEAHRAVLLTGVNECIWNNDASVKARIEAASELLKAVDEFILLPLEGVALTDKLERLWESLPAIERRPENPEHDWNMGLRR